MNDQEYFSPQELDLARANMARAAANFPDEQAHITTLIRAKGLEHHPGVIDWYLRNHFPIRPAELNAIDLYRDSISAGSPTSGSGDSAASPLERLYFRSQFKPSAPQ